MGLLTTIFAINWEPELRGILTVIIAVVVLCGSVYLILGTNLGVRLGFLVALAGLAGWMALMGVIWMIYGIGLQGPLPSWEAIPGRTVIQSPSALASTGVLDEPVDVTDLDPTESAAAVSDAFIAEGWVSLGEEDPAYGQAFAAAQAFVEETEAFAAGQYVATGVYDIGGDRWPKINESLDFLAFFHEPHYVVVEVAAVEPTRTESGRAPAVAIVDESRPRQYVYMVRDLGARRQPAAVLTVGGGLIFVSLCWLLHRRDQTVDVNLAETPEPAAAS